MAENKTSAPEWATELRERGRQDALDGKKPEHVYSTEAFIFDDVPDIQRRVYYEGYQQGKKELLASLGIDDDEG